MNIRDFSRTIGVVGIDATLEEIESILLNDQWGSVYAFLINSEGETIFHPRLRPSSEVRFSSFFPLISFSPPFPRRHRPLTSQLFLCPVLVPSEFYPKTNRLDRGYKAGGVGTHR